MKVFKIKNSLIIGLVNFLGQQSLHGNESRQRTRFIKLLTERAVEIEKTKKEIIAKYAKKDEKGEVKVKKEQNGATSYDFEDGQIDKANKELEEYLTEDFLIDILEEHKEKFTTVRRLVLETNKEFQGTDAIMYNEWSEAFEAI